MTRRLAAVTVIAWVLGCESKTPPAPLHRVELRKLSGGVIELVPLPQQPAWCLVYSVSDGDKVVRQLTMSRDGQSFECPAGEPIGKASFRIPVDEGPVKLYVLFSDQRLSASAMSQQIYDLSSRPTLSVLDLRAPGRLVAERLAFTPEEETPPSTGTVIDPSRGPPDAGA